LWYTNATIVLLMSFQVRYFCKHINGSGVSLRSLPFLRNVGSVVAEEQITYPLQMLCNSYTNRLHTDQHWEAVRLIQVL